MGGHVLPTLGTNQSVLIRGAASFQGSRLEGVHCDLKTKLILCQQYKEPAIISISRYVLLQSLDYVLHIINVSGVLLTLGTYQSVLIRGVASFQGSRLEGVHCITLQ